MERKYADNKMTFTRETPNTQDFGGEPKVEEFVATRLSDDISGNGLLKPGKPKSH